MLTHRDRLLEYITDNPGLDDDQLSSVLQIIPRQTVNVICRQLESEKLIVRSKSNGKIRNFPMDTTQVTNESITDSVAQIDKTRTIVSDEESDSYFEELSFLISLKESVSSLNNRIHSRAVRLSLKYLKNMHPTITRWDTSEGSDSGVDLARMENDEIVVVGEVKTTIPHYSEKLGAAQASTIKKDFEKLKSYPNATKYFFVLDDKALLAVVRQFGEQFNDVRIFALERCYS